MLNGQDQPKLPQFREETRSDKVRRAIRRIVNTIWFECSIALLVIASVGMTLAEMGLEISGATSTDDRMRLLVLLNDLITIIFVLELSLRFWIAHAKSAFFREYWLDIIAVLPMFRVFRSIRALRLLRLIRVLRLLGVMTRLSSNYPSIFRKGLMEYIAICGLLVITVVFATMAMTYFENTLDQPDLSEVDDDANPESDSDNSTEASQLEDDGESDSDSTTRRLSLETAFWFSIYSLFAGEPVAHDPATRGGKVVTVFVMFMGLTIFAMFTGTVSAYMVDRFRSEGNVLQVEDLVDHIIICGWNKKSEIIIQEFRATKRTRAHPIVVISESDPATIGVSEWARSQVCFLQDDFTRVPALERAGVHRAKTCIILADQTGGRSDQDADARTILAALTVERINANVYTCAELLNQAYGPHLQMGNVNDYVISGDYSAYMLAQSAMNRGLMEVIGELLTYQRGNEFYRYLLPEKWHGKQFVDLMVELKQDHNAILVAVHPKGGEMTVNPKGYQFEAGDEIVIIASSEVDLNRMKSG